MATVSVQGRHVSIDRGHVGPGFGAGVIADVVTIDGAPVARRVRVYDQRSGALLAETWSDDQGRYVLSGLARNVPLTVIADDHTWVYNSVCASGVTAA